MKWLLLFVVMSGWETIKTTDPMLDTTSTMVCTQNQDIMFCVERRDAEIYTTVLLNDDTMFVLAGKVPSWRIDKNKPVDLNPIIAQADSIGFYNLIPVTTEANHVIWRIQANLHNPNPAFIDQAMTGNEFLLRIYIHGGRKKDYTFSLDGFAEEMAPLID